MKSPNLVVIRSTFKDDKSGRVVVRFCPVFTPDVCAQGSLSFACWEGWEDEPEKLPAVELAAVDNARAVMARFSAALACSGWEVQGGVQ